MTNSVRVQTQRGLSGTLRASVPAGAASVCRPAPERQSAPRLAQLRDRRWKPPAPIVTCIFGFVLFLQASALPLCIGFLLLPTDASSMTRGCKKMSCCTPFCYLDKDGVHHCVHHPGDSCECGMSDGDFDVNPVFLSAIITLPKIHNTIPLCVPSQWSPPAHLLFEGRTPSTPTPPPK